MQDNTEVTPMWEVVERYYLDLRPRLTTQAERAALDAFYLRIRLVEDTDAVEQIYEAYEVLRDQLTTQPERDAIGDLCQGLCSYGEGYVDDDDIMDILPDWPYNLFAMVHGRAPAEVTAKVEEIAALLGDACRAHTVLTSTRILKKTGLRLAG